MPTYILLLKLTPEGRHQMLANPDGLVAAEQEIEMQGTEVLGSYAVLGDYDFVTILSAPDNESAARFSVELGVAAGVSITTLPAIPIGRLEEALSQHDPSEDEAGTSRPDDDYSAEGD